MDHRRSIGRRPFTTRLRSIIRRRQPTTRAPTTLRVIELPVREEGLRRYKKRRGDRPADVPAARRGGRQPDDQARGTRGRYDWGLRSGPGWPGFGEGPTESAGSPEALLLGTVHRLGDHAAVAKAGSALEIRQPGREGRGVAQLWHALHAVDKYLRGQAACICCDLFIRRLTRKFAVPSVIDVPTRRPARCR